MTPRVIIEYGVALGVAIFAVVGGFGLAVIVLAALS